MRKVLSLLTVVIVSAYPAWADVPLVRVGKTSSAPRIDGKLNDVTWQRSVAVSDFSIIGGKRPATEATQVRLAYDAQNLYVGWRCNESLLKVAQQRMHEVRSQAKTRDDDVLGDDSVLLFLQPDASGTVYEFNVNSIGTLFDARSRQSDLWGARDASWNAAGAQVASVREDGFWTSELALPWKALGRSTPPTEESVWKIILSRRAAGRNESSTWNQSEAPVLHLVSGWGEMVFGNAVPGLSPQLLADFEAGKSTLTVQLASLPSQRVDIEGVVTESGRTTWFQGSATASEKPVTIQIPITARAIVSNGNGALGTRKDTCSIAHRRLCSRRKVLWHA